jgi:cell division transport system permease protein
MKEILGDEASILELFEDNPFEAYMEIRIYMDDMESVLNRMKDLEGISHVRDNREVLGQVERLTGALRILGLLVTLAVGCTTFIIISHMIRQGIYNNRDQINTLRLLGAPNGFIGIPYVLAGLLLTVIGGTLASLGISVLISRAYAGMQGTIPFIPLPPRAELTGNINLLIMSVSFLLGFFGSLFGLSSIRNEGGRK